MFQYHDLHDSRSTTSLHLSIITKTSERLIPTKLDEVTSVDSNSRGFLVLEGLVSELRAVHLHRTATCMVKFVVTKANIYRLVSLCAGGTHLMIVSIVQSKWTQSMIPPAPTPQSFLPQGTYSSRCNIQRHT